MNRLRGLSVAVSLVSLFLLAGGGGCARAGSKSATYLTITEVSIATATESCLLSRTANDASCHILITSGQTIQVVVSAQGAASPIYALTDDCNGAVTGAAGHYSWTAPIAEGICKLTASAQQNALSDSFSMAVQVSPLVIGSNATYNDVVKGVVAAFATAQNALTSVAKGASQDTVLNLDAVRASLLTAESGLMAIYNAETHSPSLLGAILDHLPYIGSLSSKVLAVNNAIQTFADNPDDSSVAEIKAWCIDNGLDDYATATSEMRKLYASQYEQHAPDTAFHEVLQESGRVIVQNAVGQYASLIGDGLGGIVGSAADSIGSVLLQVADQSGLPDQAVDYAIETVLDYSMDRSQRPVLIAGSAPANGDPIPCPAGRNDLLFTIQGDAPRVIVRDVAVTSGETITLTRTPGQVSGLPVIGGTVSGPIAAGVTVNACAQGTVSGSCLNGGFSASVHTDPVGRFTVSGLTDGNYLLRPSAAGFAFSPASILVTIHGADVADQDFTATSVGSLPYTQTLASGLNISSNIAVDSSAIYWTEDDGTVSYTANAATGLLRTVGVNGGTVTTIASGLNHPDAVLIDATHVYWIERGSWPNSNGTIKKMPKNGGTATTLASGLNYPQGPSTMDSGNVYFGDPCDILKVGLNGGAVTPLATTGCWSPSALSVDSTGSLFYLDGGSGNPRTLDRVSVSGGTVTALAATSSIGRYGTVLDDTYVYWTDEGGVAYSTPVPGGAYVYKISKSGGAATTLASGLNAACGIALDSTTGVIYVAEAGTWAAGGTYNANSGTIGKLSTTGGALTTLTAGLNSPSSIAVDSASIYWSEGNGAGTGAIRKMPK